MMKRIVSVFSFIWLLAVGILPADAQMTKSAIMTQITTCFPDQMTGAITPAIQRQCLDNIVNSYQQYLGVRTVTGVTDTLLVADYGQLVTYNNGNSIAVTLPQGTGSFFPWNVYLSNLGVGTVTVTPTSSTIGGASSLTLKTNQSVHITSDGANYQVVSFASSSASGSPATPPACTRMWPASTLPATAWNVVDAYGNPVSTTGTTSQGLQEAINFAVNNGQCLQVYGQGSLALGNQSAVLNSSTTVTGLTSTANLKAGDYVVASAGGIPLFTTISSIDSATQIHISNAATVSASRTLTFTRAAGPNRNSQITATATITIPPVEIWAFQAYDVNLTGASTLNGPLLQFDSAIIMGFDWVGGVIVYQPSTPTVNSIAVLVAPTNPVPQDGVITVSDSHIFISNIAVPAVGGTSEAVVGFNIAGGSVNNSRFAFEELNGTGTGSVGNTNYNVKVFAPTATTSFEGNIIDIAHAHLSLSSAIQIGVSTTNAANLRQNIWRIGGIKPSGASSAGISSFGSYDIFQVGGITNEEGTLNQAINLQSSSNGNKIFYGQILGAGTNFVDSGTCNSWVGANGAKIALYGTTSGCATLTPPATGGGVLTLPAGAQTLAATTLAQTWSASQSSSVGGGGSAAAWIAAATANSAFAWQQSSGAADAKWWDVITAPNQLLFRAVNDAQTIANQYMQVNRSGATISNVTFPAPVVVSGASFGLSGNISAAAWTTNGIRYANVPATLTDTTSSGTVATVYNDVWGGNTNAATSATTYTNALGSYFKDPIAGANVTFTNPYALGADSLLLNLAAATDHFDVNITQTQTTAASGSIHVFGTLTANANNAAPYRFEPTITGTAGTAGMQGAFFAPSFTPTGNMTTASGTQYNTTFTPGSGVTMTTANVLAPNLITGSSAGGNAITTANVITMGAVYSSLKPSTVNGVNIGNLGSASITTSTAINIAAQSGSTTNHGIVDNADLLLPNITNVATTSAVCVNTSTGLISYDGTIGTCTVSDERLKNIGNRIDNALNRLLQINGFYYTYKDQAKYGYGEQVGVGAQTVEKVFPELVSTDADGLKSVAYDKLAAPIIEAMRELKADNDNLRACQDSWKCRLFGVR